MGGDHGGDECVEEGDFIEVEIDLENTGVLADANGEAEWEMNSHRVKFSVEIEDVPVGDYSLHVGGAEVDPSDFGAPAALITPQLVERPAWKNPVGFAETDPADIENVREVIPNEILVACQHMGTSSSFPSAVEFSGLTSLDDPA